MRWAGVVALLLGVGATACGGRGETTSPTTSTSGTSTTSTAATTTDGSTSSAAAVELPDAARLWSDVLRDVPADVTSDVIEDRNRRWAFTALGTTATVWSFDGQAWGRERRSPLTLPATNLNGRIVTTDLTGDGHGDALIPLLGNGFFGTVLSNDGGDWRAVPFTLRNGDVVDFIDNLEVQGRDLVTYEKLCDPSCAGGAADEVTWVYDVASASFVEHDRVQVSAAAAPPSTLPPAPTAPPPPAPALPAPIDPKDALDDLGQAFGAADTSRVVETGGARWGVVVDEAEPILFAWGGSQWVMQAVFAVTGEVAVRVTTADVTNDGVGDFVIQFANGDGGVISTARIGQWEWLPFENLDGAGFVLFPHDFNVYEGDDGTGGMQTLALVWKWNPSWGAFEAFADA